ncbi:MAG: phosphoribosylanthranilate isomerase [Deltaproteobacteria bacterium]|nr:phosphoribosylanthranilate isomerase [Deltaproteobacteria bacterium]
MSTVTKPLIKVCGLTRPQDATTAAILGADFCGFVFHPKSPRAVTPLQAGVMATPYSKRVGVFVENSLQETIDIMGKAVLEFAQLHGDHEPEFARSLGPAKVIKVFWPDRQSPEELTALMEAWKDLAAYFLFDAGKDGGGSGKRIQGALPNSPKPYFLAGGLTDEFIHDLWPSPDPMMVGFDLNSGIEKAPGQKDIEALKSILPWR